MPIFQPTDVSGLFAWYKAHSLDLSTSGAVTYWQDSSGSGNHISVVFPSSNTTCPVYVPAQLNGYPSVRFDGSNDYLAGTGSYFGSLPPSSLTSFIVYKSNSNDQQVVFANDNDDVGSPLVGAKNNFILGINSDNNTSGLYFGWGRDKGFTIYTEDSSGIQKPNSQWYVRSDRWRITDNEFIFGLNGTDFSGSYVASMSQSINNRLKVGATVSFGYPENFLDGDVAEIVAYSRRLNELEVSEITNYLLYKYNISNSAPMSLFTWSTDNGSESGIYKPMPLYTYSINISFSGCSLYTYGVEPTIYETGVYLYTQSSLIQNTGVNLYIPGNQQYNNIPIYLYGGDSYYNNFPLYTASTSVSVSGLDIYMTGYPTTFTAIAPLYIGSSQSYPTGINLYTSASTTSALSVPLFTSANANIENECSLFVPGQTEFGGKVLYVYGKETSSSGIDFFTAASLSDINNIELYTAGKNESVSQMYLFIKQLPAPTSTKQLSLFTNASSPGSSGLYNLSPLYMYSHGIDESMFLYVHNGENYTIPTGYISMPLFIRGPSLANDIYNNTPLIIYNNVNITGKMNKLYIRGDGVMDGALIYNDNMNMFLKVNAGAERGFNLYIENNSSYSSGVPFYTDGVYNYSSGIGLSIRGFSNYGSGINVNIVGKEGIISGISLYVRGDQFTILNNALYTHGF